MSDLVTFEIPADFVNERVVPTQPELVYGYTHGWLSPTDAIAVALFSYESGAPLTSEARELAFLLSADMHRLPELMAQLTRDEFAEEADRLWLFLALAWVHDHRQQFDDPLQVVEMLYADFGYPRQIEGLVRYMPVPDGSMTGLGALEARWREFLFDEAVHYKLRPVQPK